MTGNDFKERSSVLVRASEKRMVRRATSLENDMVSVPRWFLDKLNADAALWRAHVESLSGQGDLFEEPE